MFTFGNTYGDSEAQPNKNLVRKLIDYAKKFGVSVYEKAKSAILKLLQFGKATYARAKLTIEILMKYTELVFISPRAAWRVATLFNEHVFDVNYESDPVILEAVIKVSKDEGLDAQMQFDVLRVANALYPYAANYQTVERYIQHLVDISVAYKFKHPSVLACHYVVYIKGLEQIIKDKAEEYIQKGHAATWDKVRQELREKTPNKHWYALNSIKRTMY